MTKKKGTRAFPFFVFHIGEIHGARGETRTLTLLKAEDFESSASTIPPPGLSRESGIILIFSARILGGTKNKIDRAEKAQSRPQVVKFKRLLHVKHGKGYEDTERDDFLQNFKLRERKLRKPDSVCRDLK